MSKRKRLNDIEADEPIFKFCRNSSNNVLLIDDDSDEDTDFDYFFDKTIDFFESKDRRHVISAELAERSKYFDRLFQYHSENNTISVPEFLNQPFNSVLEFIRYGNTTLNNDNVYSVFLAADFLLLNDLKTKCIEYIRQGMQNAGNAITLWISTKQCSIKELETIAFETILQHFENAWRTEEFLKLEYEDLRCILLDERLNCESELSVLNAIDKWIRLFSFRDEFSYELFCCSRISLLSKIERDSIRFMKFIRWDCKIQNLIDLVDEPSDDQGDGRISEIITNPRLPHEMIMVFGGSFVIEGETSCAVQAYDFRTNSWTVSTNTSTETDNFTCLGHIPERSHASCAIVNSKAFIVGGINSNRTAENTILCFDFNDFNGQWFELSCMNEKRAYLTVSYLNGFLYAMGGKDLISCRRRKSAERYNILDDRWYIISSMNRFRSDASSAELNGKIYVCGGFDGRQYQDTCEFYNPINNDWTLINRMISPRAGFGLVKHSGYLYAIGGNNGVNRLECIERYNFKMNMWESVGTMNRRKSNLSAVVIHNNIFIIGGVDGRESSNRYTVEIFNELEKFNIQTKLCTKMAPLRFPIDSACAGLLTYRNYIVRNNIPQRM